jgi:FHA domain-containing protein
MIRIEVSAFNGVTPAVAPAADFDETGGTIGRAPGNALVLADENRYISRTQASIAYRAGGYVLRDLGSATPTIVNGAPVGNGNEVPVREGDEIRIGEYVLHVSAGEHRATALPVDPFADLLPAASAREQSTPAVPPRAPAGPANIVKDPLAAGGHGSGSAHPQANVIPSDFDPFADLIPPSAPDAKALPADPLDTGVSANVDDLFGLKTPTQWDPLAPADPLHGPAGTSASTDPLAGFGLPPPAVRGPATPAQRDDAPLLSGAFRPPKPVSEPAVRAPAADQAAPNAPPASPYHAAPPPTGMVVSWDTGTKASANEIKTAILSSPKRAAAPEPAWAQQAESKSSSAARPSEREHIAQAPAAGPQRRDNDQLLRAFLTGAGVNDLNIPGGLTPEFMNLLGEVLREALRGTLDLLLARALTKREVRAQATVIVARENNPLKFSPTVEAALANLLSAQSQSQGFMMPVDAMRDAYNDLRSHQFGFMAGMRAALAGVLARFDPAQLEQRLTAKSVIGSIIPSSRRAKLWELYEQLYRDISREAEDDFQTLFGKEFLRAYEAQIEKLEQEDATDKR